MGVVSLDIENLNKSELIKFNKFLLKQIDLIGRRKISLLFRGDKLENLYNRLGVPYNESISNHKMLLDRLFMIGEKSKTFYSDEFFGSTRNRTIKIDDCNKIVFDYIFDKINSSAKSKNIHSITFFTKNEYFKQYFLNKKVNKKQFSNIALSISPTERVYLRNYYLKLLHQLGEISYKNNSHLVSTSKSNFIAGKFAGSKSSGKRIKLHTWIPITNERFFDFLNIGLPMYKSAPYPRQYEISILAGILPHYIIGLEIIEDKSFFINPNIFTTPISDSLFIHGLNINQTEFDKVLNQTKYRKSFEVKDKKIKERIS